MPELIITQIIISGKERKMKRLLKNLCVVMIIVSVLVAFMPTFGATEAYAASKIKLNKTKVVLIKGKTTTLKVKGTSAKVKWSSSDKSVAKVSSKGKVTAKGYGTCYVYAKVKGKKLKCKVVVETKTANQARKLRTYILKKGKCVSKSEKEYRISGKYRSNEGYAYAYVYANKKDMKLRFEWIDDPVTPYELRHLVIDIKLIQSATPKEGDLLYTFTDLYSEYPPESKYEGWISTDFDAKEKGVSLYKYTENEVDNPEFTPYVVTDPDTLATYVTPVEYNVRDAFKYFDKLFKAKKIGVTMKSIGFNKY